MNEEEDLKILELYIENALIGEERQAVEKRLSTDSAFASLYGDLKLLIVGIKEDSRRQLTQKLKKFEEDVQIEGQADRTAALKYFGLAAAVIGSVVVAVVFFLPQREEASSEKLFRAYFQPYENVAIPSVRGANTLTQVSIAFQKYDEGKFTDAIKIFESLPEKNATIHFYLGNSYLSLGDAEKAITSLESSLRESSSFHTQSEWYLALAHLKNNDLDKCRSILQKIKSGTTAYAPTAKALLDGLSIEDP